MLAGFEVICPPSSLWGSLTGTRDKSFFLCLLVFFNILEYSSISAYSLTVILVIFFSTHEYLLTILYLLLWNKALSTDIVWSLLLNSKDAVTQLC